MHCEKRVEQLWHIRWFLFVCAYNKNFVAWTKVLPGHRKPLGACTIPRRGNAKSIFEWACVSKSHFNLSLPHKTVHTLSTYFKSVAQIWPVWCFSGRQQNRMQNFTFLPVWSSKRGFFTQSYFLYILEQCDSLDSKYSSTVTMSAEINKLALCLLFQLSRVTEFISKGNKSYLAQ